jgi:hypothetical protein
MAWIGAALAAGLLAGCDERTKQANDPAKPTVVPKVASQPMVPQLSSSAVAGERAKDPLKR